MTGPYSQGGFPEDQGPVYGAPNPYGYQQPLPPPSMYGFGDPYAPYGRHPVTGEPYSDKSKATAGLLQILLGFFGICGVGRLYIGSVGIGLCQLLGMFFALFMSAFLIGIPFAIGIWIWAFVDGIVILSGQCAGRCSPGHCEDESRARTEETCVGDWPREGRTFSKSDNKSYYVPSSNRRKVRCLT